MTFSMSLIDSFFLWHCLFAYLVDIQVGANDELGRKP